MTCRPWNFHAPSLPPEVEVHIKETYSYTPCPQDIDPTGLNGELLHHLWQPGPHLDHFWLDTFPKKLHEELRYISRGSSGSNQPTDDDNAGWGIRVIEGVNWQAVACLALVILFISAGLAIVYSALTHDVGGGFGMAAFLGILPALSIAILQLRPNT